jgi:hypothetical protein
VFDRWGVLYQDSSDGHLVNTRNIDVIALDDGGMNPGPGLAFNILNNEFSVTGDGIYAFLDFSFGFHVSTSGSMMINGNSLIPFHYKDPGLLATIGRNAAVARIFGISFSGFIAWVIWVFLHIYRIIGFRNRIVVMFNWAWDYFFYDNQVRLITKE